MAVDRYIEVPDSHPLLVPLLLLLLMPLQLLDYYAALERGCNVDQPRNLEKGVTVE